LGGTTGAPQPDPQSGTTPAAPYTGAGRTTASQNVGETPEERLGLTPAETQAAYALANYGTTTREVATAAGLPFAQADDAITSLFGKAGLTPLSGRQALADYLRSHGFQVPDYGRKAGWGLSANYIDIATAFGNGRTRAEIKEDFGLDDRQFEEIARNLSETFNISRGDLRTRLPQLGFTTAADTPSGRLKLTDRQSLVADLIANRGTSIPSIGRATGLNQQQIEKTIGDLFRKTGLTSSAGIESLRAKLRSEGFIDHALEPIRPRGMTEDQYQIAQAIAGGLTKRGDIIARTGIEFNSLPAVTSSIAPSLNMPANADISEVCERLRELGFSGTEPSVRQLPGLTEQQTRLALAIANGSTFASEIAAAAGVNERNVTTLINRLQEKLGFTGQGNAEFRTYLRNIGFAQGPLAPEDAFDLKANEKIVVRAILAGNLNNSEIGRATGKFPNSVASTVKNICEKIGINPTIDRAELKRELERRGFKIDYGQSR
jgi:DNA-binding NarL/FixJ family response regulator